MVEIDHTAGDDLSEECRMTLVDAFTDSFAQVYGVDGMHALIESEETFPNRDTKQANLQYYGAQWRVYWVSSPDAVHQYLRLCPFPFKVVSHQFILLFFISPSMVTALQEMPCRQQRRALPFAVRSAFRARASHVGHR